MMSDVSAGHDLGSLLTKRMSSVGTLSRMIADGRVVRVTAADWNGKEFDGAPLVGVADVYCLPCPVPEEIVNLLKVKDACLIDNRGGTDYAWFGIKDEYNNTTWAGPGDYIVRVPQGVNGERLIVVPDAFMTLMLMDYKRVRA